jgi:glycosyltransferase involved in cell wall biosynthesis
MARPLVSVCMITYNHERFIRQAVESALMQKASFDFEIVIGEDCSKDSTRAICNDIANAHSGRIRLLQRTANVGMHRNLQATYAACRGQFIALLEGDDFWTDNTKLQRQVDVLESDNGASLVFHPVRVTTEDGTPTSEILPKETPPDPSGVDYVLSGNTIPTCSVLIRKSAVNTIPKWLGELPAMDFPLFVVAGMHGNFRYIANVMGAYRVHPGGVWSSLCHDDATAAYIDLLVGVEKRLPSPQAKVIGDTRRRVVASVLRERSEAVSDRDRLQSLGRPSLVASAWRYLMRHTRCMR